MGVGFVLDDHHLPKVPGTVILEEDVAHSETVTGDLKHGRGKNAHIVLTPQPSEDPNDPLNWSQARKLTIMLITGMGTILYGACFGPLLNASLVVIAIDLNVTITDITLLSGYQVLVVGCTAPFVSACSRKYGKRSLFVLSSVSAVIGNIIGSTSKNYNQLLAARIIQGFSVSTYESLLLVVIGDLFFVHERGIYFSIVSFLLVAISNLASVVCGPITTNLGWKYLFHIFVAISVVQTILQIFFVPETTYRRDHKYEIDELTTDNFGELVAAEHQHEKSLHTVQLENAISRQTTGFPAKKTFWENMKLFDGTYSDENLLALIIAPFAICMNASVCYVIVVQAWFVGLFVAIAFVLAQIFAYPPYHLNPSHIGYLSLGPFVGGLIAMLLFGAITDRIMMYMTRRNKGVYEPEYRLLISVLGVASGAGLFGYGYVTQNSGSPYVAATVHGVIIFGVMALIVATSSYALDAYRDMNNEIFIMGMMSKNFLLYGFTYFINDWLARTGPQHVFNVFGVTGFAVMVGLPIMYVFGKKYRSYWHRHNLLEKFHIRTHAE
ncbi:MFS general substrate transporter [Hyaloscypha bicolor E]|uniref:MFS general substrate transporter n=1 Tax=Hyaloscypha bicolor E TaxID=1095630 RepID=A0A2J6SL79_9HELO|nr:MFS general substrate transporter [Hyaloscypha bicolor E]PMD51515.1 MFS general substrate transporter [Hyaloscypha bicolor E]